MTERRASGLAGAGVILAVVILCLPLAAVITLATLPVWRGIETTFGIEAIGHSGPAGWCYLAVYTAMLVLVWVFRTRTRRR